MAVAVIVGVLAVAAVPAAMLLQDGDDDVEVERRETRFLAEAQRALRRLETLSAPVPEATLLAAGQRACDIYADGGDVDAAADALRTDWEPAESAEGADQMSTPVVAHTVATWAGLELCPEHEPLGAAE